MSLPMPTARQSSHGPANPVDPKQLQAMDAPLVALTQQCRGDLRQLMYAFFSFLNRRTDFYLVPHPDDAGKNKMGFSEGDAEKMLIAAFRQFPLRRIPRGGMPATGGPKKPTPKKGKEAPRPANKAGSRKESLVGKKEEDKLPQRAVDSNSSDYPAASKDASGKNSTGEDDGNTVDAIPPNMKDVHYNEEGLQIPVGNGGSTPRYKWTQTLDETTVLIGVPKSFRGKDYDVSIGASTLSVKARQCLPGEDSLRTFVDGALVDNIRVEESTWSVEGGVMTVTLDKKSKRFWTAVYKDDVEKYKIDTELVDSRRRIDDYDEATQAHFRKMIFDQNQYHLNGPTSDEILGKTKKASNIPGLPPGVEYKDKSECNKTNKPELPPGVEYIDKKTLDEATKGQK